MRTVLSLQRQLTNSLQIKCTTHIFLSVLQVHIRNQICSFCMQYFTKSFMWHEAFQDIFEQVLHNRHIRKLKPLLRLLHYTWIMKKSISTCTIKYHVVFRTLLISPKWIYVFTCINIFKSNPEQCTNFWFKIKYSEFFLKTTKHKHRQQKSPCQRKTQQPAKHDTTSKAWLTSAYSSLPLLQPPNAQHFELGCRTATRAERLRRRRRNPRKETTVRTVPHAIGS